MTPSTPVDLKAKVREKYGDIASQQTSGCGCGCSTDVVDVGEDYSTLDGYVADADLSLGCGLPTEFANIQPGETVLDLGSGAGNDVFIAWRLVGDEGHVIGVDMTEEMITLARQNAEKVGAENVTFKLGDIEDLPLENDSVDLVVSNCVLNLVPDKRRAFAEILRVLKPGGRFCISDIVLEGELPETIQSNVEFYVGCVSGAMQHDAYLRLIEDIGFEAIDEPKQRVIEVPEDALSCDQFEAFQSSGSRVLSITVRGQKGIG